MPIKQVARQAFKPDNALNQAYKTLNSMTGTPAEMIAATQILLRTYRRTMRTLTRELKAVPCGELADMLSSNIRELSAKIATLELALQLHKNQQVSEATAMDFIALARAAKLKPRNDIGAAELRRRAKDEC